MIASSRAARHRAGSRAACRHGCCGVALIGIGALIGSRFAQDQRRARCSATSMPGSARSRSRSPSRPSSSRAIVLTTHVRFADVVVAFAPGAMDAMLALALTLHIDPIFVGAHHLSRFVSSRSRRRASCICSAGRRTTSTIKRVCAAPLGARSPRHQRHQPARSARCSRRARGRGSATALRRSGSPSRCRAAAAGCRRCRDRRPAPEQSVGPGQNFHSTPA